MIKRLNFLILIGFTFCCSNCPSSDLPSFDDERYTCAHAVCIVDSSSQPNGNQICSVNYESLASAQYHCYIYKCDKIIQYNFHGSEKYEILKKSCSGKYCSDSLEGFTQIDPNFDSQSELKYQCVGSPCITQTFQPNGNQYCEINFGNLNLAKSQCQINDCDTIIRYTHNDRYMYEILKSIKEYDENVEVCGDYKTKDDIEFLGLPHENRDKNIIRTEIEIHGHSSHPFKQITKHYIRENITEITVEAHNDYDRNTFFLIPENQLRVAVIGNHTCIFSDIFAYDFDEVPTKKSQPNLVNGIATKKNIIEIQIQSSFRQSDINIDFLPRRVVERCEARNILELDYVYLRDETTSEIITIENPPLKTPIHQNQRLTRVHTVTCPSSYCKSSMHAQCSGRDCPNSGKLPTCWYAVGSEMINMEYDDYYEFYHYTDQTMFCIPCCAESPTNHRKMPYCSQISNTGKLCDWYWKNGRCGENF